jgi:hypothetical protein
MPPAHSRPGSPTLVALALLSAVFGPGSCARGPAVGRLASPPPAPAIASPEVTADGRVTFRLWAPRAQRVWVRGLFFHPRLDMTRDPRGVWTARTGPVAAGLYEYHFVVDDLAIVDPANPDLEPSPRPENSLLEIPGDPPPLTAWQDVPHGTVHVHHSRARAQRGNPAAPTSDSSSRARAQRGNPAAPTLGSSNPPQRVRRVHVYTPPGYETTARGQPLPMLVLLQGAGGNDATWSVYGRAGFILDNLLAQKRAQPMIVVMPDGHAPGPAPAAAGSGARPDNTPAFARELFEDVLPLVESRYPVRPDAAGRAIVGLSMGGRQALRVVLETPGRFAWVGAMGASVPTTSSPAC